MKNNSKRDNLQTKSVGSRSSGSLSGDYTRRSERESWWQKISCNKGKHGGGLVVRDNRRQNGRVVGIDDGAAGRTG